MASMNVSVKVGTAAAVVLRQLKEMDVDQIRREGRCCEVLRSIREDAERFDQRFRNAPNAEGGVVRCGTLHHLVRPSESRSCDAD